MKSTLLVDEYSSFQSTPPAKAATKGASLPAGTATFQSTPPAKAATCAAGRSRSRSMVSIHAAREGGDRSRPPTPAASAGFNPRRPRRRRLDIYSFHDLVDMFQSTPPAKAATFVFQFPEGFNPRRPRRRRPDTESVCL